jgi:protein O-GlcNAc transferase
MTRRGLAVTIAFVVANLVAEATWANLVAEATWAKVIAEATLAIPVAAAAQSDAARAKAAYERAIDLEAQGNDPAALSLLWEAAGLSPRDADVQNRLGEALERIGALDAAIEAYRRATAERPAFRKASNNLILALAKAGRGAEAVERAAALAAEAPGDADRLFTLGLAQAEQDVSAAIATFQRVLQMNPRHTLARYNLALVLRRVDRLPDALHELDRAIAIEPRAEAHYLRGVILMHQGDLSRAADALRSAIRLDPRAADAYFALGGVLKSQRDWTAAAESLQRAIALRADFPSAYYTLAQVLRASGDEAAARAQEAESERQRRRADEEHAALVWTSVGIQKAQDGDLLSALDSFRRATAAFDRYAPAHYQMGLVLERLGQPEAAQSAFAKAHALNPSLVPPIRQSPAAKDRVWSRDPA